MSSQVASEAVCKERTPVTSRASASHLDSSQWNLPVHELPTYHANLCVAYDVLVSGIEIRPADTYVLYPSKDSLCLSCNRHLGRGSLHAAEPSCNSEYAGLNAEC